MYNEIPSLVYCVLYVLCTWCELHLIALSSLVQNVTYGSDDESSAYLSFWRKWKEFVPSFSADIDKGTTDEKLRNWQEKWRLSAAAERLILLMFNNNFEIIFIHF